MRIAGGKVPQIANADIINEVVSMGIDAGDPSATIEHIGPLRFLVPVQLAHATGLQTHIHPCQGGGDGQLARRHLTRPASRLESVPSPANGDSFTEDRLPRNGEITASF